MLERRALAVLVMISSLSACATTQEFSFENIYDEVVALLSDDSDSSVTDRSDESVNLEEDSAPGVVPGDDEPASWLIKNGCSLDSVTVGAEGERTWKMRCPNSRWVTLTDNSL
tara:strand:- start:440 stop:778 length:339 start_codon:yes stop_codon:yes gene_type:complete